jgi:hypothetical protein
VEALIMEVDPLGLRLIQDAAYGAVMLIQEAKCSLMAGHT